MKIAILFSLFFFVIQMSAVYPDQPVQKSATEIAPSKTTDAPSVTKISNTPEKMPAQEPAKKEAEPAVREKAHEAPRVTNVYFYPSGGDSNSGNSGSEGSDSGASATPSDDDSKGGVAYVSLGQEGSANSEPSAPDAAAVSNEGNAAPPNQNFQRWLEKHPDIKARVQKQQESVQGQIQDNQAKLKEQFKSSNASAGQ